MAKAAVAGHRVVLVVATRGERGEVAEGYLSPGEELWQRRVEETRAAGELLGVSRVEFLGYVDSGMAGTDTNDDPACFWRADVEEAARRLAEILDQENAHVLTAYDENGVYGHPDHVQVHRVGVRAAEIAGTRKVYLSTVDKDHIQRTMKEAAELGIEMPGDLDPADLDLGVPGHRITTRVDVTDQLDLKRQAMRSHASQIAETSFFLTMHPEMFRRAFGLEWYILQGAPVGTVETDLFEGL